MVFLRVRRQASVTGIGQAIVQAARPRAVVAPLQLGLAVQAHHMYRSQFLVDTLPGMGFASSYKEVWCFEKNVADSVAPDMLVDDMDVLDMALLFAGDNVDHNILTIDGESTIQSCANVFLLPHQARNVIEDHGTKAMAECLA